MKIAVRLQIALTVILSLHWCGSFAQVAAKGPRQEYPVKPVRLIVPIAPGGSNDLLARALAQKFSESLGQPVIVDNRAGGGGTIGTELAAKSAPDGHTLLMVNISHAVNPSLHKRLPYDPLRDFAAVGSVASSPNILVVHPALQVASVQELLRQAKAHPKELHYGSAGNASSPHLAMELLKLMSGADMVHVPYKGTGPALTALLGREVSLSFSTLPPAIPHMKAGRLRALALSTRRRSTIVPDVPTLNESGVKGFDFSAWFGLVAPAGTPKSAVARLNSELSRVVTLPEIAGRFSALGMDLAVDAPEHFQEQIRIEVVRWAKVINSAGIRLD